MGLGIIHDQSVRRRETVRLRLRFLDDYVVIDLQITSFLARHRRMILWILFFMFNRLKKDESQAKKKKL